MTTIERPVLYRAAAIIPPAVVVGDTPARLVVPGVEQDGWGLDDERRLGAFAGPIEAEAILHELELSGLRGRGGAGFPVFRKWSTVAGAPGECVVVANGHEGEPASSKDRWLLTRRPHLVLDGLLIAAATVGASEAIVCVSHEDAAASVESAIADLQNAGLVPEGLTLRVFRTGMSYVAGEESAICQAINGGPALPTDKPPRPFEAGVRGLPTLINNVETLAHVAWIRIHGGTEFASAGTETAKGTALFTVTGACERPGVYEMELGRTVAELIAAAGGSVEAVTGLLVGGWFGGVLDASAVSLPCCYDAFAAAGGGLGCAAVTVLGPDDDIVETATELAAWYQMESAKQCGVCVSGTGAIARTLRQISRGVAGADATEKLARWGSTLSGRGACSFIDGASALARSAALELTRRESAEKGVR
ncbi:NADH dehydrogenase subunit F [Gordonia paraffinivorans]|uniref:NADH-ubiquinone oxidoreductase-F iron-sulfur binding region domain-containing protein n=1 Tax=Gordonia paraffinivorans TaxID=175628 RepID=UPI000D61C086|nr:NADH-ubiquinone oxidoreductase-F iron-sulfur binding region domain-containing protein [Gordonia paraffinivorans]PWD43183.1 NADH dehydrogenase subunit F [Gordonia paraffinivorans]